MVECSACAKWLHYGCAGVDASVKEVENWRCAGCKEGNAGIPPGFHTQSGTVVPTVAGAITQSNLAVPSGPQAVSTAAHQSGISPYDEAKIHWVQNQQAKMDQELERKQHELERKRMELRRASVNAINDILGAVQLEVPQNIVQGSASTSGINPPGDFWDQVLQDMSSISFAPTGAAAGVSASLGAIATSSSTPTTSGITYFNTHPGGSSGVPPPNFSVPMHFLPTTNPQYPLPTPGSYVAGSSGGLNSSMPMPQTGIAQTQTVTACSTTPAGLPPPLYSGGASNVGVSGAGWSVPWVTNPPQSLAYPWMIPANYPGVPPPPPSSMPPLYPQLGTLPTAAGFQVPPRVPELGVPSAANYSGAVPVVPNQFSRVDAADHTVPVMPNQFTGTHGFGAPSVANFTSAVPAEPNQFFELLQSYGISQSPVTRTRDQLIARQVMPKDLPTFQGNPDDWPLFFSAVLNSTRSCGYSLDENMARLQKALDGKAFAAVKGRLLLPQCVPQVLFTLYQRFGRPEVVLQSLMDKVDEFSTLKSNDFDGLVELGTLAETICDHAIATGQVAHLCNPDLIRKLASKLPESLLIDWGMYKRQLPADLRSFTTYMSRISGAALEVNISVGKSKFTKGGKAERGRINVHLEDESTSEDQDSEKNFVNTHREHKSGTVGYDHREETKPIQTCLACEGANHKVKDCTAFKEWDISKRWKVIENHHLCRTCLGKHGRRPCKSQVRCGVNGCGKWHNRLLHVEVSSPTNSKQDTSVEVKPESTIDATNSSGGLNAHHAVNQSTLFKIVPVTLSWKGRSIDTHAFLDSGSSVTLVNQSVTERLGVDDGVPLPLRLNWTGNMTRYEPTSQRVALTIAGIEKQEKFELMNTRTVASLDLPKQALKYDDLSRQYAHLEDLPVDGYGVVYPEVLIGLNNSSLIETRELREGQRGEPLAARTQLGWTIFGCIADEEGQNFSLNIHEGTKAESCISEEGPTTDKSGKVVEQRNETVGTSPKWNGHKVTIESKDPVPSCVKAEFMGIATKKRTSLESSIPLLGLGVAFRKARAVSVASQTKPVVTLAAKHSGDRQGRKMFIPLVESRSKEETVWSGRSMEIPSVTGRIHPGIRSGSSRRDVGAYQGGIQTIDGELCQRSAAVLGVVVSDNTKELAVPETACYRGEDVRNTPWQHCLAYTPSAIAALSGGRTDNHGRSYT